MTKFTNGTGISKVWVRLALVAVFYFAVLGIAGSWLVFHYVYDIAATYYSLGVFGLPIALLVVFFFDRWASRKEWFKGKLTRLMLVHLVLCCPLYYLLITLVTITWFAISGVKG